jgi:hypothetical protein
MWCKQRCSTPALATRLVTGPAGIDNAVPRVAGELIPQPAILGGGAGLETVSCHTPGSNLARGASGHTRNIVCYMVC